MKRLHIRGIITDSKTHLPLAGVTVSAVQAKHDARTDTNGYFSLELHGVVPGAEVLIHIEKGGYRAIDLTEAASDTVVYPIRIFLARPAPKTRSEATDEKTVPNPLEVVTFDSDDHLTIANNGPLSVYLVSILLKSGEDSLSYDLGFDIEPHKIYKHSFSSRDSGDFPKTIILHRLADTWNEHLGKAKSLYLECGMMLVYFSPSDTGFLQYKDAYSGDYRGRGLSYGDASGTLYYRVKGFTETKEQSVPLVVIVAINGDKCPH